MKKNAILIAGIMFVAGCASSHSQRASYDATDPSHIDSSASASTTYAYSDHDDVSADSTKRGGSLDARGYHKDANNDELEGTPDPINPGKQADSSIRGGSVFAREREWNHDAEQSSGTYDENRHMKADSSIRGGSIEARGGREVRGDYESGVEVHSDADFHSQYSHGTRDDFGQGSSATWQSDEGEGAVRGSANWNASDDLMRDGVSSGADSTASYEFKHSDVEINNDASVGGAASAEVGEGSSSFSLEEQRSEGSVSGSPGLQQNDLNSSERLEENISGEYELETESSIESDQSNARDTLSSSSSSASATDIHHDESDLNAIESAGAAASAEVGSASSDDNEFDSNDPGMQRSGSPLGTAGNEPNFLYQDNRAHGVGSAASGDFANAPVNQGVLLTDDQLAERVKSRLTAESTGTHGLMLSEVARNIQVSAENGEVTLTGTVPSENDKKLVEIRARELSGVRQVNNQLMVTSETDPAARDLSRGSDLEDVTNELQD